VRGAARKSGPYRDLSADPGVVSEARAVATLPPTSLAYNTNAENPSTTNQL
jgi:hypothetical protein